VVEEADLIAPAIPTLFRLASEELDVWTGDKSFDQIPNTIGFPAVFAARLHHYAPHVLSLALRLAACGEQAELLIGACPVAHTSEIVRIVFGRFIKLHPAKANGLVFEAPGPNKLEGTRQKGIRGPKK
jgi:hypothetical protein